MALYPAIAGTSLAILGLLEGASADSEFAGVPFEHYHGSNLERPMAEGISLWLYRVSVNAARNQPLRVDLDGITRRPPIPLDLHYLVTAWAADPIQEQRLFGWAVRTLEDTPMLPAGVLNQHLSQPDVFRAHEALELVWQSLSFSEALDLWEGVRTKMRPSAAYLARAVEIESEIDLTQHPEVQTRELVHGTV